MVPRFPSSGTRSISRQMVIGSSNDHRCCTEHDHYRYLQNSLRGCRGKLRVHLVAREPAFDREVWLVLYLGIRSVDRVDAHWCTNVCFNTEHALSVGSRDGVLELLPFEDAHVFSSRGWGGCRCNSHDDNLVFTRSSRAEHGTDSVADSRNGHWCSDHASRRGSVPLLCAHGPTGGRDYISPPQYSRGAQRLRRTLASLFSRRSIAYAICRNRNQHASPADRSKQQKYTRTLKGGRSDCLGWPRHRYLCGPCVWRPGIGTSVAGACSGARNTGYENHRVYSNCRPHQGA